jgi:NIPSNAP protein
METSMNGSDVPIIELRQYTLHPGQRDVMIELFEREFIESQETLGMKIVGTFRDLDRPDRFVWIRGFRDMDERARQLEAFYSGPVWKAHREAANATMIDSDNVLLLHEARPGSGFRRAAQPRAGKGATAVPPGLVIAAIHPLDARDRIMMDVEAAGIHTRASYVTETRPNNFPRLPVRENDHVFVWFATFADAGDCERAMARLTAFPNPFEVLRLEPTPRSELHGEK